MTLLVSRISSGRIGSAAGSSGGSHLQHASSRVGDLVSSVLHHTSPSSSPSSQAGLSVSAQVKNILNRHGLYLHERIYELTRILEPCLAVALGNNQVS